MNLVSVRLQAVRPTPTTTTCHPYLSFYRRHRNPQKDMCLFTLSKHLLTEAKIIGQAPCGAQGPLHEPKPSGPPRSVVRDMKRQ